MSLCVTKKIIMYCLCFSLLSLSRQIRAQRNNSEPHGWWHGERTFLHAESKDKKLLPLISVKGNHFVNPSGEVILFKGVSIGDPDKIDHEGHWDKSLFEHIKDFGAMIVRIPVHPVAWRKRTPKHYLSLLDSAVSWCTAEGIYVDIDWHSIGNLETELFQDSMYNTTLKETYEFWRTIAHHFNGNNTIAFYEIFNEPTSYRGQLGNISWGKWKEINESIIHLIRACDSTTIPLVAGFDWAYDLTPLREEPINAENIGYVTHPYPFKRTQPWEPKWEEDFGFAARKYPVIATEIGFSARAGDPDDGAEHYGSRIIQYLQENGISWVAWVYDPEWAPQILKSWKFDLTRCGGFFKKALQEK